MVLMQCPTNHLPKHGVLLLLVQYETASFYALVDSPRQTA